jgi:predicted transcriptional regulator
MTSSALAMMRAMKEPATAARIAESAGLPLFRVRSGLREMVEAKLVLEHDGIFQLTESGSAKAAAPASR